MDGFAPAVEAGGLVYVSALTAPSPRGEGIEGQVAEVLQHLDGRLQKAGSSLARALSLHVQLGNAADFPAMNAVWSRLLTAEPPARTTVVAPLTEPGALLAVGAVAAAHGAPREVLRPADWQPSPNPYSYAVRSGDIVFCSGLVPRDGRTNTVVHGDVATQARVVLDNAGDVLAAAGLTLDDVVAARVFLTDAASSPALDAIYGDRLRHPRPPRSLTVAALMNPAYTVEMTFVAMAGKRPVVPEPQLFPGDEPRTPAGLSEPSARFESQALRGRAAAAPAVAAGARVFVSAAGDVRAGADVEAQTRDAVARLGATLAAAGLDLSHVAEVELAVTDGADAASARRILIEAIGRPPAGTTWVCGLIDPGVRVEICATAVRS